MLRRSPHSRAVSRDALQVDTKIKNSGVHPAIFVLYIIFYFNP